VLASKEVLIGVCFQERVRTADGNEDAFGWPNNWFAIWKRCEVIPTAGAFCLASICCLSGSNRFPGTEPPRC